jgi:hypothetical protein
MTKEHPEFPVYANITVELDESWTESGAAGVPSNRSITDARFVDLGVSFDNVSREKTLNIDSSMPLLSNVKTYYATKSVAYSVKVDFGETEVEHRSRILFHWAEQAVKRGLSARSYAESTHFGELKGWELRGDVERERRGQWTLAEQREHEERLLWVQAYIEYTFFHGPDEQYTAALRYLEELRRRPHPIAGEVRLLSTRP